MAVDVKREGRDAGRTFENKREERGLGGNKIMKYGRGTRRRATTYTMSVPVGVELVEVPPAVHKM